MQTPCIEIKASLFGGIIFPSGSLHGSNETVKKALQFDDKPQPVLTYESATCLVSQWIYTNPMFHNVKDSSTFFFKQDRYVIVTWSRLDNRFEIALKLHIHPRELSDLTDGDLILKTYLRFGSECAKHLVGDFAFVIYDTVECTTYCARDPIGIRPFFYAQAGDILIFATHMSFFHKIPFFKSEIDELWLSRFILNTYFNSRETTCCTNIKKLLPGHVLTYRHQQIQITRYHDFDPDKTLSLKDKRDYIEIYQDTLKQAVSCRLSQNKIIGAELSGGLDSTSVIGVALECDPDLYQTLHTFGHDKLDFDGIYMDEALSYWKLQGPHHRFQNDEMMEHYRNIPETIALLGQPEQGGMASYHIPFYRLAEKKGIQVLLSGFGGDEVVTHQTGFVILELLSKGQFKKAWQALPGPFIEKILRFFKYCASLSCYEFIHQRYYQSLLKEVKDRLAYMPLATPWKEKFLLIKPHFNEAKIRSGICVNQECLQKLFQPALTARLEASSVLAAAYKIEYVWPLLDVRLIELFLSIPSEYKWFQGIARYLHREAMIGKIPERIRQSLTKYMGKMKYSSSIYSIAEVNDFFCRTFPPSFNKMIDVKRLNKLDCLNRTQIKTKESKPFVYESILHRCMQLDQWLNDCV